MREYHEQHCMRHLCGEQSRVGKWCVSRLVITDDRRWMRSADLPRTRELIQTQNGRAENRDRPHARRFHAGVSLEETPYQSDGGWFAMRRICTVGLQLGVPRSARALETEVCNYRKRSIRCERGQAVPCGLVAIGIARMFQRWGDTPKTSPAQLTALRRLQSDLGPVLARIDQIPSQTDDPALNQAAERVHDALRELLAETADVIKRARRRPSDQRGNPLRGRSIGDSNSISSQPEGRDERGHHMNPEHW